MSAVDGVNLAVGIMSITLAIVALLLSNRWSQSAERQLAKANEALAELRSESDSIVRAVEQRLDDMVRRAMPSVKETTEAQMMGQTMPSLLEGLLTGKVDPEALKKLGETFKND